MSSDGGEFGARLRACRQAARMSQQELAERSGLSVRAIGRPGARPVAALTTVTAERAGQLLEVLTRACMIQPAGPGRHSLQDLLRGYSRELAAAQDTEPDQRAALTRLLDYYRHAAGTALDAAFPAERHRRPAIPPASTPVPAFRDAAEALAWLAAERANLVAVTVHSASQGWAGHAIQLAATLFRYLDNCAQFPDAIVIHGHARLAARDSGDRVAEANALHNLGAVDLRQGRYQQAVSHLQESLALCRETGDRTGQARALANLGIADILQGRSEQAVGHFRQSVALHRDLGDRPGEARALGNLGMVDLRQGRYQQAIGHLEQSLALCRDIGDWGGEARALANLGEIEVEQGRYQQAGGNLRRALTLCRQLGDRTSEADTLVSLGAIDLRQGRNEQAAGHLRHALALCRAVGDLSRQALTLNRLGQVLLATGHTADARAQHAAGAGDKIEQARAHDGLAGADQASGTPVRARRHWQAALALFSELGAPEADQVRVRLAELSRPETVVRLPR